jgi:hypothetical protein
MFLLLLDFLLPLAILVGVVVLIRRLRPGLWASIGLGLAGLVLAVFVSSPLRLVALMIGLLVAFTVRLVFPLDWPWEPSSHHAEVNYRLEVTREVDGEPLTGSVVQEYVANKSGGDGDIGALGDSSAKGQALVMELPGDRPSLIVAMFINSPNVEHEGAGEPIYDGFFTHTCDIRLQGSDYGDFLRRVNTFTGSCPVPPEDLPLLLAIDDLDDPATLRAVDPANLEAVFGPGVRFIEATVSVTDTPLTTGIKDRLPWLSRLSTPVASPAQSVLGAERLRTEAFFREEWL